MLGLPVISRFVKLVAVVSVGVVVVVIEGFVVLGVVVGVASVVVLPDSGLAIAEKPLLWLSSELPVIKIKLK